MNEAFQLARPWALLLLAAVPLAVLAILLERRRAPRLRHPRAALLLRSGPGWAARLWWLPQACAVGALALVAVALARPRALEEREAPDAVEGIDLVVALDLSTSMLAADFRPVNRIQVAKEVLTDVLGRRRTDRIGLVVFAGEAYTRCPLTLDYGVLRALVAGLRPGAIDDGTAIGNAIGTAVNRLRESDAKSKAIVLITDGDNNAGQLSPREAAELARVLGVRIFPILVGKGGSVPYPVGEDLFGGTRYEPRVFPVNPALLEDLARITGGVYANATDKASLEHGVQDALDRMEKSRLTEAGTTRRAHELFPALLEPAFWLCALALLLGLARWRSFP